MRGAAAAAWEGALPAEAADWCRGLQPRAAHTARAVAESVRSLSVAGRRTMAAVVRSVRRAARRAYMLLGLPWWEGGEYGQLELEIEVSSQSVVSSQ